MEFTTYWNAQKLYGKPRTSIVSIQWLGAIYEDCKLVWTSFKKKQAGRITSFITVQTKWTNQGEKMKNELNVILYLHFLYCFSCCGVRHVSVELQSLVGPQLIPKLEDEYICSIGGMIIDRETEGSILSTTNNTTKTGWDQRVASEVRSRWLTASDVPRSSIILQQRERHRQYPRQTYVPFPLSRLYHCSALMTVHFSNVRTERS